MNEVCALALMGVCHSCTCHVHVCMYIKAYLYVCMYINTYVYVCKIRVPTIVLQENDIERGNKS